MKKKIESTKILVMKYKGLRKRSPDLTEFETKMMRALEMELTERKYFLDKRNIRPIFQAGVV